MKRSVLILKPPDGSLEDLRDVVVALVRHEADVSFVDSFDQLCIRVRDRSRHHLVFLHLDSRDGSLDCLELVGSVRRVSPETSVVVVAEIGNVELAASVIAAGATDLVVRGEQLRERIATLLGKLRGLFEAIERSRELDEQNERLRELLQSRFQLVGQSSPFLQLLDQIQRVAAVPRPVLIVGERGTGKELVARAIHFAADGDERRPIVPVNCAAFGDALLESELFGHEKGAFTGADAARAGRFAQADGGTLFLDEVGNMSLAFQQKILRVVEYGTYTPVGAIQERRVNTRVLAATNVNLTEKMHSGEFLRDLYDRLSFEVIQVPALRERPGDVAILAQHFLNQFAEEIPSFQGKRLARSALEVLGRYRFPGNVRELKNIIERAAYRDTTNEITPEDLGLSAEDDVRSGTGSFHERINALSRRLIQDALVQSGQNQAQAARLLGLTYDQFRYYQKKFGLSARQRG